MSTLNINIVNLYSQIHTRVDYTNDCNVSFEGSQKQCEFFKAWEFISKYYEKNKKSELSFLEVGAWKGLWGIAFYEFCKLNNIKGHYVTVTWINHDLTANRELPKVIDYLNNNSMKAELVNADSTTQECVNKIKAIKETYDLVFIDASHQYEDVMKDISNYANMSKDLLMFHDIRPIQANSSCGVYQAISDSKIVLDEEIHYNGDIMGIGIKYIK